MSEKELRQLILAMLRIFIEHLYDKITYSGTQLILAILNISDFFKIAKSLTLIAAKK